MTVFTKPDNPGVKITFEGEATIRPDPAVAGTVAIPLTHDWGPLGSESEGIQTLRSFGEFEKIYGNSDTQGRRAVMSAFLGTGIDALPHRAGAVVVYRMGTASAEAATLSLQNTTPAAALTLDAKYAGERGNRLSVVVEDHPTEGSKDRLRVLFDDVTVESFTFTSTDIAALAAAINARPSSYITATSVVTGVDLAQGTFDLASGDNGDTLTATEWGAALDALEFEPFSILAPYDDFSAISGLPATFRSWVQTQEAEMRPVVLVCGGPADETLDEAITRTAGLRDHHIVSLGAGNFRDDFLDAEVSTAQLAPRIAGILAGLGEEKSLTYVRLAALSIVGSPEVLAGDLKTAYEQGLTVFRRTASTDADLMVAKGVTTFIDPTTAGRPLDIFSDPRLIRVIDLFIRDARRYGDENIIGATTVSDESRAAVRSWGNGAIASRLERGLISPGISETTKPFFRVIDTTGDPELEDAIPFEFGWLFNKTTNYLLGHGKIS